MSVLSPSRPLLEVRNLRVSYGRSLNDQLDTAVSDASFEIDSGEILGMQGPSGCGKTSTALAILKLLPADTRVLGSALFEGRDLLHLSERELRQIRGKRISIMYQEPTLALNPVIQVGDQIAEVARTHGLPQAKDEARIMLRRVGLEPKRYYIAYPHELSGGERHRVVLAQALICRPRLLIADEPTASLDPQLKNEILTLIDDLRREFDTAFLLISHDRSVTSKIADRVFELTLSQPIRVAKPLLNATQKSNLPPLKRLQEPLLTTRDLRKCFRSRGLFAFGRSEKQVLDAVTLQIYQGSLMGLVGPSGSGKSTLCRCLALLEQADSGEVVFEGKNLLTLSPSEIRKYRPMLQYVAQDPSAALNPRMSAVEAVEEPLLVQGFGSRKERRRTAIELMQRVGLDPVEAQRSCHEFSGGQKHRIAIARALALQPKLLIFDESLSGLDPETQADILSLLRELKETFGITELLVSHDLELITSHADNLAVMRDGRVVEYCTLDGVVDHRKQWWVEHSLEVAPKRELVLAESE